MVSDIHEFVERFLTATVTVTEFCNFLTEFFCKVNQKPWIVLSLLNNIFYVSIKILNATKYFIIKGYKFSKSFIKWIYDTVDTIFVFKRL